METLEETAVEQRLLIHENLDEQQRIRTEIESRRFILNTLAKAGLTGEEIISVTSSLEAIEKFIFKKQLEENQTLKTLVDSGIKGLSIDLSPELNQLSYDLKGWFSYKTQNRNNDKFENLIFDGHSWQVDEEALEQIFVARQIKFYIEGEAIKEHQELEKMIAYFESYRMPNNQLVASSFLNSRIEPIGQSKYRIRWSYFRNKYPNV